MERNYDGESVSARYYGAGRVVTGKLSFERRGMRFQGNSVQSDVYVPYQEISGVDACNSFGMLPNSIMVHTQWGKEYKFSVSNRKNRESEKAEKETAECFSRYNSCNRWICHYRFALLWL